MFAIAGDAQLAVLPSAAVLLYVIGRHCRTVANTRVRGGRGYIGAVVGEEDASSVQTKVPLHAIGVGHGLCCVCVFVCACVCMFVCVCMCVCVVSYIPVKANTEGIRFSNRD